MTSSGKSLIGSIQAKSIEGLDLLVRESVQNSLDASLDRKPKTRVDMDFITGDFNADELNSRFGHVTRQLNGRYPGEKYQFIAIRDSNTHGLTGSNDKADDKSRLQSLVYHISKMQTEEGSGGSWGLGKTVFFGIGTGLVIYYSRTSEDGKYRSKLAATLVEDEDNNPLISEEDYRGISFFGKYGDNVQSPNVRDETVPITDESYIGDFLKIFDIEPYGSNLTGTTVIIPYVRFDKLLDEMKPIHDNDKGCRDPVWTYSIEEYFKIALQRWYFPRLANPAYNGSWLKACINGDCISRDGMHPFFKLYQELYNASLNASQSFEYLDKFGYETIEIRTERVEGQTAGFVAASYVDINDPDLNLTSECYRNIYSYVGRYDAVPGSPIVTFTRNAGMLVRYDTENSPWVPNLGNLDENKTLVAIFRLALDKKLRDGSPLEEYVRASEKSDHNNWEDHRRLDVITKLSDNTRRKLREAFVTNETPEFQNRSNLSRLFADILLPERTASAETASEKLTDTVHAGKSNRRGKGKRRQGFKSRLDIGTSVLKNDLRIIEFHLRSDSSSNTAEIYFEADSESGSVSCSEWEAEFNTEFPLSVMEFEFTDASGKSNGPEEYANRFNFADTVNVLDDYVVIAGKSEKGVCHRICIRSEKPGFEIKGRLAVKSSIRSTSFEMKHRSPGEGC